MVWHPLLHFSSFCNMAVSLFISKKNQIYWLSAKCLKLKQITVKGIFKLLNEIRQMKLSYKLYAAIKMSYILFCKVVQWYPLLKNPNLNHRINYEMVICFTKGFTIGFRKLASLEHFKYLICYNLLLFQFTRAHLVWGILYALQHTLVKIQLWVSYD